MKKITLLAVLMSLVFSAGAFAKNAYELYNEAYDLYLVNDYKAAVRLFTEAIKKKPDFVKPYNKAGLSYAAMKKYDHAILMYKKAVYIEPEYAEAYYNMAIAMELKYKGKADKLREIEDLYLKAISLYVETDSNSPNMQGTLSLREAALRFDPDKFRNSGDIYTKAIALNVDRFTAVRSALNLAKLYKGEQKYDEAIMLLRAASKAEPDFAELYNETGLVWMENGNNDSENSRDKMSQASGKANVFKTSYDYAVKAFEKALEVQQRYPEASTNLGIAFMKQGKLARAIKQFELTLASDPNFAGAHYNYANALIINGFYEKAISHLQKAAALDPEMFEAHYSLGKAYEHLNMFNEAEKAYKTALEKNKDYVIAKNAYDTLRKKREDFRSHITFKKKVVEGEEVTDEQAVDESEMTKEQLAAAKKAKAEAEDVEDLRLPEDKPTPAEGEENQE